MYLVVAQHGGTPFIRARLEAKWEDDGTIDGSIEQHLWWVRTGEDLPAVEDKERCESRDRGLIQVHYIPAVRDPSSQLRYAATTIAGRLIRAMKWSEQTEANIIAASERIREIFGQEQGIQIINQTLTQRWNALHDDVIDAEPEFNLVSKQFAEILRSVGVVFRPTETGSERVLDDLSDGQKSLFYFSLISTVFDIERRIVAENFTDNSSINTESNNALQSQEENAISGTNELSGHEGSIHLRDYSIRIPILTIFALEEPENHLSPYFLSRIINQIHELISTNAAQAVLTSHSSAILGRIEPQEVRHFRLEYHNRNAVVGEIHLPHHPDQIAKYVHGAVQVYPELYFARFVILGEGDSEQVILPRLASAMGFEIDRSFVAIVPLGGRHVNYFWKLFHDLKIPYATLLDLDWGREGAGWGRIKYVCNQLLSIDIPADRVLKFTNATGQERAVQLEELSHLGTLPEDRIGTIVDWIQHLEQFGVFFSEPLDLDLMMLHKFPHAYQSVATANGGPRIPDKNSPSYRTYLIDAAKAVVGNNYEQTDYDQETQELFPWYRYLFLNKSKPSTHLQALCKIETHDLTNNAPSVLTRLINFCQSKLVSHYRTKL